MAVHGRGWWEYVIAWGESHVGGKAKVAHGSHTKVESDNNHSWTTSVRLLCKDHKERTMQKDKNCTQRNDNANANNAVYGKRTLDCEIGTVDKIGNAVCWAVIICYSEIKFRSASLKSTTINPNLFIIESKFSFILKLKIAPNWYIKWFSS